MMFRPLVVAIGVFGASLAQAQTTHSPTTTTGPTTTGPTGIAPARLVQAEAPEAMVALMQELGYRAELTTDGQGDPKIRSAAGGANFSIYFYGCTDHRDCRSVQFSAGFDTKGGVDLLRMNDWNRNNRYGQASLDEEDDPYIEMDILMQGGLSRDLFEANLSLWDNMLADFQRHIDW